MVDIGDTLNSLSKYCDIIRARVRCIDFILNAIG